MRYGMCHMSKKLLILIPALALFGQGCINVTVPSMPAETVTPTTPTTAEMASCPNLPKVYYFGKVYFSATEIDEIERNVIRPVAAYYSNGERGRVVSLTIEKTPTGITVVGITDLSWTEDGGYFGFTHDTEGGTYPVWEPFEVPEGYEG